MLESTPVPALTRAIAILHFISQHGPCPAAEIIEGLALPKSSTYLLLAELKKQRFVAVDIYDNYCLWTRLVELAGHALERMDIREIARKRLTALMQETNLLCHLGIIDSGNAYYILKVESTSTISVRSHEGKSLSLYRSGIGKCLLAWQPEEEQARIIDNLRFVAVTPNTLKDAEALKVELIRIRRQGWSFDNGEDYPDVRCVAAPLFNASNELTAAISLVGTSFQINDENREYLASQAIACARDISRLLGWHSPVDQPASQERSIR
ncbi:IclR family transcriptional regulator [Brenneria roseae subsp. americana]|uniref:IclR family transcriptional regulator n=1 Tax=Brenneria roseae subsp. americana TaxID=1508507 RepID=A0A2U1TK30_9GAMM|nr:IclR family transcriptional regulator [Brenneria roseae]PWC09778.1 IclR family transcriptional regulator [Brenneria roseae subsp. americana]